MLPLFGGIMIDNGIGNGRDLVTISPSKELVLDRRVNARPPAQETRESIPKGEKMSLTVDTHWEKGIFIDTYA
jgi:hypothetical protein